MVYILQVWVFTMVKIKVVTRCKPFTCNYYRTWTKHICYLESHLRTFILLLDSICNCRGSVNPGVKAHRSNTLPIIYGC